MAWFTPGSDPTQPWEMHAVSEPSAPGKVIPGTFRFSHGLGTGDLNGDGRAGRHLHRRLVGTTRVGPEQQHALDVPPRQTGRCRRRHDRLRRQPRRQARRDRQLGPPVRDLVVRANRQATTATRRSCKHDLFPDLVSETHALIAADINRDGLKDLVTGKRFWSHGTNEPGSDKPARLYWFEAARGPDGKITFTPREIDDQSGIGTQFVVADFNGDGLLDIVTANKKGVFLSSNRPASAAASQDSARHAAVMHNPSHKGCGRDPACNGRSCLHAVEHCPQQICLSLPPSRTWLRPRDLLSWFESIEAQIADNLRRTS